MTVLSMYNDHVTRNVIQHNNALNYNLNKSIFPLMAIILHTFYLTAIFMLRVYISVTLNSFLYILPTAIKFCMHCPFNYCTTAITPLHGTFL